MSAAMNRSGWERDPDSGKRRRLLRPESDQATWDRVKERQQRQRHATQERAPAAVQQEGRSRPRP
jgi:hypothetical protein